MPLITLAVFCLDFLCCRKYNAVFVCYPQGLIFHQYCFRSFLTPDFVNLLRFGHFFLVHVLLPWIRRLHSLSGSFVWYYYLHKMFYFENVPKFNAISVWLDLLCTS